MAILVLSIFFSCKSQIKNQEVIQGSWKLDSSRVSYNGKDTVYKGSDYLIYLKFDSDSVTDGLGPTVRFEITDDSLITYYDFITRQKIERVDSTHLVLSLVRNLKHGEFRGAKFYTKVNQ